MRYHKNLDFLIPPEGSFVLIDSFVIPVLTKKEDLTYAFINFLYKEEVLENNFVKYGFLPTIKGSFERLHELEGKEFLSKIAPFTKLENFKKLSFFKDILSNEQLNNLWVELKAK
jgi:spermidine/putrescine-binding protein